MMPTSKALSTLEIINQRPAGQEAEQFSYKATQFHPSRPAIWPIVRSEEWDLRGWRGTVLWSNSNDMAQNFPLIRWAINFFLGFTASFEFQPRINTGNEQADLDANLAVKRWHYLRTRKKSFDVQNRMSREQMFRCWGYLKLVYGDTLLTLADGGKCQLFEAWQIAKGGVDPKIENKEQREAAIAEINRLNEAGLELGQYDEHIGYGIATGESTGGLTHRMIVPVDAAVYSGAFNRPSAIRPPSPLASALNFARDYCTNVQNRLTLGVIQSLFGMAIFRDNTKIGGSGFLYSQGPAVVPTSDGINQTAPIKPPLQYELKAGLPIKLELEKDEKVEFLESKTPSTEWIQFQHEVGRLVLAAIGVPYSAYDSRQTNFSAQRGDFNIFKNTVAEPEREENADCMREVDAHVLNAGIADGSLTRLPAVKKLGLTRLEQFDFEEIPAAAFILDDTKEWDAVIRKVEAGFATAEDGCHEMGTGDFYEITRRRGREQSYQKKEGVTIVVGKPGNGTNEPLEPSKNEKE